MQKSAISSEDFVGCDDEDQLVDLIAVREELPRRLNGNLRCFRNRITIDSTTDRWKRNRLDSVPNRELQRVAVATCENFRFAAAAAPPNRADRVNDETRGQIISASDFSFAWSATPNGSTFDDKFWSGSAMDRAVDSAATEQRRIRGVHNCIDIELGDVAAGEADFSSAIFHFTARAVRSANCRQSAVCNENGRAGDSGGPARIPLYRVLLDNHPSAAAGE